LVTHKQYERELFNIILGDKITQLNISRDKNLPKNIPRWETQKINIKKNILFLIVSNKYTYQFPSVCNP